MSLSDPWPERLLWAAVVAVLLALGLSLFLFPRIGLVPPRPDWLAAGFAAGLVGFLGVLGVGASSRRPLWLALLLAVLALGLLMSARALSPAERTHLIEFGLLAVLLKLALDERKRRGRFSGSPGWLAWGLAGVVAGIDEGLQAVLPGRVFDPRDLLFNALAVSVPLVMLAGVERLRSVRLGHR